MVAYGYAAHLEPNFNLHTRLSKAGVAACGQWMGHVYFVFLSMHSCLCIYLFPSWQVKINVELEIV